VYGDEDVVLITDTIVDEIKCGQCQQVNEAWSETDVRF